MDGRISSSGYRIALSSSSSFEPPADGRVHSLELVPELSSSTCISAAPEELAGAWRSDRRCAECGEIIVALTDAALLVREGRVAHATSCFIPALLRGNPSLSRLAARACAQEVDISRPSDRNGGRDATRGERDG